MELKKLLIRVDQIKSEFFSSDDAILLLLMHLQIQQELQKAIPGLESNKNKSREHN